jgi:DNA-binding transcriptional regulator/RsmH inhibitor MraZ
MPSAFFHGTYNATLNDCNWLPLPEEMREQLVVGGPADELLYVIGKNEKVWIYPEWVKADMATGRRLETKSAAIYLNVNEYAGLMLTRELIQAIGPNHDLTLVGVRDHFELWNRAEWEKRLQELDAGLSSICEKLLKRSY